jgi:hypothetical protein
MHDVDVEVAVFAGKRVQWRHGKVGSDVELGFDFWRHLSHVTVLLAGSGGAESLRWTYINKGVNGLDFGRRDRRSGPRIALLTSLIMRRIQNKRR